MNSESEARISALLDADFPSTPECLLEDSFLNPTWADGARGGIGVARRRLGVLLAALAAGDDTHPVMADHNIRHTVRDELLELEAILEAVERELEREERELSPVGDIPQKGAEHAEHAGEAGQS